MMRKLPTRALGLMLLPLTPALAVWALYVFRKSRNPEDHGYQHNLRLLAGECWHAMRTGDFL